jgi:hypothetical protein
VRNGGVSLLHNIKGEMNILQTTERKKVNLLAPELFFFNFSTPYIYNVNNTGTKYVRIMKQTAF